MVNNRNMEIHIIEKNYRSRNGKTIPALKDIDLFFEQGKMTLIIGTSGAGKSTIIKCILQKTHFNGFTNGYDRTDVAYIPQFTALNLKETVYSAIYWTARFSDLFARNREIKRRANSFIQLVGLEAIKESKIGEISGGQKQRVSIAKELVRGKKIILADEIDTGLDCGTAKALIEKLKEVTKEQNKTTIVISHNLTNIDLYDDVVVLAKDNKRWGRVVYSGSVTRLKSYFNVGEYVDILTMLNPKEEGGKGLTSNFLTR